MAADRAWIAAIVVPVFVVLLLALIILFYCFKRERPRKTSKSSTNNETPAYLPSKAPSTPRLEDGEAFHLQEQFFTPQRNNHDPIMEEIPINSPLTQRQKIINDKNKLQAESPLSRNSLSYVSTLDPVANTSEQQTRVISRQISGQIMSPSTNGHQVQSVAGSKTLDSTSKVADQISNKNSDSPFYQVRHSLATDSGPVAASASAIKAPEPALLTPDSNQHKRRKSLMNKLKSPSKSQRKSDTSGIRYEDSKSPNNNADLHYPSEKQSTIGIFSSSSSPKEKDSSVSNDTIALGDEPYNRNTRFQQNPNIADNSANFPRQSKSTSQQNQRIAGGDTASSVTPPESTKLSEGFKAALKHKFSPLSPRKSSTLSRNNNQKAPNTTISTTTEILDTPRQPIRTVSAPLLNIDLPSVSFRSSSIYSEAINQSSNNLDPAQSYKVFEHGYTSKATTDTANHYENENNFISKAVSSSSSAPQISSFKQSPGSTNGYSNSKPGSMHSTRKPVMPTFMRQPSISTHESQDSFSSSIGFLEDYNEIINKLNATDSFSIPSTISLGNNDLQFPGNTYKTSTPEGSRKSISECGTPINRRNDSFSAGSHHYNQAVSNVITIPGSVSVKSNSSSPNVGSDLETHNTSPFKRLDISEHNLNGVSNLQKSSTFDFIKNHNIKSSHNLQQLSDDLGPGIIGSQSQNSGHNTPLHDDALLSSFSFDAQNKIGIDTNKSQKNNIPSVNQNNNASNSPVIGVAMDSPGGSQSSLLEAKTFRGNPNTRSSIISNRTNGSMPVYSTIIKNHEENRVRSNPISSKSSAIIPITGKNQYINRKSFFNDSESTNSSENQSNRLPQDQIFKSAYIPPVPQIPLDTYNVQKPNITLSAYITPVNPYVNTSSLETNRRMSNTLNSTDKYRVRRKSTGNDSKNLERSNPGSNNPFLLKKSVSTPSTQKLSATDLSGTLINLQEHQKESPDLNNKNISRENLSKSPVKNVKSHRSPHSSKTDFKVSPLLNSTETPLFDKSVRTDEYDNDSHFADESSVSLGTDLTTSTDAAACLNQRESIHIPALESINSRHSFNDVNSPLSLSSRTAVSDINTSRPEDQINVSKEFSTTKTGTATGDLTISAVESITHENDSSHTEPNVPTRDLDENKEHQLQSPFLSDFSNELQDKGISTTSPKPSNSKQFEETNKTQRLYTAEQNQIIDSGNSDPNFDKYLEESWKATNLNTNDNNIQNSKNFQDINSCKSNTSSFSEDSSYKSFGSATNEFSLPPVLSSQHSFEMNTNSEELKKIAPSQNDLFAIRSSKSIISGSSISSNTSVPSVSTHALDRFSTVSRENLSLSKKNEPFIEQSPQKQSNRKTFERPTLDGQILHSAASSYLGDKADRISEKRTSRSDLNYEEVYSRSIYDLPAGSVNGNHSRASSTTSFFSSVSQPPNAAYLDHSIPSIPPLPSNISLSELAVVRNFDDETPTKTNPINEGFQSNETNNFTPTRREVPSEVVDVPLDSPKLPYPIPISKRASTISVGSEGTYNSNSSLQISERRASLTHRYSIGSIYRSSTINNGIRHSGIYLHSNGSFANASDSHLELSNKDETRYSTISLTNLTQNRASIYQTPISSTSSPGFRPLRLANRYSTVSATSNYSSENYTGTSNIEDHHLSSFISQLEKEKPRERRPISQSSPESEKQNQTNTANEGLIKKQDTFAERNRDESLSNSSFSPSENEKTTNGTFHATDKSYHSKKRKVREVASGKKKSLKKKPIKKPLSKETMKVINATKELPPPPKYSNEPDCTPKNKQNNSKAFSNEGLNKKISHNTPVRKTPSKSRRASNASNASTKSSLYSINPTPPPSVPIPDGPSSSHSLLLRTPSIQVIKPLCHPNNNHNNSEAGTDRNDNPDLIVKTPPTGNTVGSGNSWVTTSSDVSCIPSSTKQTPNGKAKISSRLLQQRLGIASATPTSVSSSSLYTSSGTESSNNSPSMNRPHYTSPVAGGVNSISNNTQLRNYFQNQRMRPHSDYSIYSSSSNSPSLPSANLPLLGSGGGIQEDNTNSTNSPNINNEFNSSKNSNLRNINVENISNHELSNSVIQNEKIDNSMILTSVILNTSNFITPNHTPPTPDSFGLLGDGGISRANSTGSNEESNSSNQRNKYLSSRNRTHSISCNESVKSSGTNNTHNSNNSSNKSRSNSIKSLKRQQQIRRNLERDAYENIKLQELKNLNEQQKIAKEGADLAGKPNDQNLSKNNTEGTHLMESSKMIKQHPQNEEYLSNDSDHVNNPKNNSANTVSFTGDIELENVDGFNEYNPPASSRSISPPSSNIPKNIQSYNYNTSMGQIGQTSEDFQNSSFSKHVSSQTQKTQPKTGVQKISNSFKNKTNFQSNDSNNITAIQTAAHQIKPRKETENTQNTEHQFGDNIDITDMDETLQAIREVEDDYNLLYNRSRPVSGIYLEDRSFDSNNRTNEGFSTISSVPSLINAINNNEMSPHFQGSSVASMSIFEVVHPYSPTMEDELELRPGELIVILHVFDDGWCFARLVSIQKDSQPEKFKEVGYNTDIGSRNSKNFEAIQEENEDDIREMEEVENKKITEKDNKGAMRSNNALAEKGIVIDRNLEGICPRACIGTTPIALS